MVVYSGDNSRPESAERFGFFEFWWYLSSKLGAACRAKHVSRTKEMLTTNMKDDQLVGDPC